MSKSTRLRTMPGSLLSFSRWTPFFGPAPVSTSGIYLGTQFLTGAPHYEDLPMMKSEGGTHATTKLVTAQVGHRKTTLALAITQGMLAMQAGTTPEGLPELMRVLVHGRKNLMSGMTERDALIRAYHGTSFDLSANRSINFFGGFMAKNPWDVVEIGSVTSRDAMDQPFTALHSVALQIATDHMFTYSSEIFSQELFAHLLLTMTDEDIDAYFNRQTGKLLGGLEAFFEKDDELRERLQPVVSRPVNVTNSEIKQAAAEMAYAQLRILNGDYGNGFGGTQPLENILSPSLCEWDWTRMTERAIRLMNKMRWKISQVLQTEGLVHLIPHLEVNDEGHETLLDDDNVILRARALAKTRAVPTVYIEVTQFIRQILRVGSHNSHVRGAAETIVQTMGSRTMGHIDSNDEMGIQDCYDMGFSEQNIFRMQKLQPGQFATKLPSRKDPVFFTHHGTVIEAPIHYTDHAVHSLVNRVPFDGSDPLYRDLLERIRAETGRNSTTLSGKETR